MSKIGIIRDGSIAVNKPVKIEFINRITTTVNTIKLHYTPGAFPGSNDSEVVVLLDNPNSFAYTAAYIRERVLKWIGEGLATSTVLTLNDYLGDLVVTQIGVVGSQTTGKIIAAADSAAACVATPNIDVALDFSGGGAPVVGTGIYQVSSAPESQPLAPVAAGTYALSIGTTQYFITVNSVSNISSIEVCPLLLDFVYNLRDLTAPITEPDPNAISFAVSANFPFDPGAVNYQAFYATAGLTDGPPFEVCGDFGPNPSIYGSGNYFWPVGILNNGTINVPNFAVEDVAFGLQLADSNVADYQNAQLFISFDLNANAGVVADATFVPFVIQPNANPVFQGSPGGGIPGFGDGSPIFDPANAAVPGFNGLFDIFRNNVFLPAGSSLIGTANFTDGAYCSYDKSTGVINFVEDNTCLS